MSAFQVHRAAAVRRPPLRLRVPPGPLTTVRVAPAVWRAALRLAGGDASRLVVVSDTAVIVANRGTRR